MELASGSYSFTDIPAYVEVGKYSSIASEVIFHDPNDNHLCAYNHRCVYTTNWDQIGSPEAKTIIGSDVWIGRGVRILFGVNIGDGAIVGAGAVVAKDVPPYAVMIGNPAERSRYRFDKREIGHLLKIKWWDWPDEKVVKAKDEMKDFEGFIRKHGVIDYTKDKRFRKY